jgi:hypothetical protein
VKEVHEIFDLVRLENISEGGHGGTTLVYLMLDFLLAQAFPYGTQIGPEVATSAVGPVAMLTPLLMKERGSGLLAVA